MSAKNPINKAASIRQKLLNHAKANGQDFQRTIDSYAIECVLDRLANSAYTDQFLLKGALLFAVWKGLGKRPTRDIDLLGRGSSELDSVVRIFKEVISIEIDYDGVVFYPEHTEGLYIKEEDEYESVRVFVDGSLSGAVFKVHIDIGFGDAVTPSPISAAFPRILEMKPFSLCMYPPETVFAEKLEAIVTRGMPNSRMKDYYDLFLLVQDRLVQASSVKDAVTNTFERRKTKLPDSCPIGLSDEFAQDPLKNTQWKAFLKKSGLPAGELSQVIATIRDCVQNIIGLKW